MNRRAFVLSSGGAAALLAGDAVFLYGCNYSWLTTAINDLPVLAQVATTIAQIVGGSGAAAAVATIVQAITAGIALIQQLIKDYEAQPSTTTVQKIEAALLDLQQNLGSILTAIHVENAALRMAVTGAVGIAVAAVTEILSLLPPNTSAAAMAAQAKVAIKPRTASTIKTQVNGFLETNGYGKYVLQ
jgi:hypothetical protein